MNIVLPSHSIDEAHATLDELLSFLRENKSMKSFEQIYRILGNMNRSDLDEFIHTVLHDPTISMEKKAMVFQSLWFWESYPEKKISKGITYLMTYYTGRSRVTESSDPRYTADEVNGMVKEGISRVIQDSNFTITQNEAEDILSNQPFSLDQQELKRMMTYSFS